MRAVQWFVHTNDDACIQSCNNQVVKTAREFKLCTRTGKERGLK